MSQLIHAPPSVTIGRCRTCREPIVWGVTSTGAHIPIDADRTYQPTLVPVGQVVPVDPDTIGTDPPATPIPVAVGAPPNQTETLFGGPDQRPRWNRHRCRQ
ncbi:MAG: hypothetical protein AAF567_24365 [Actinomycetota bacterium]